MGIYLIFGLVALASWLVRQRFQRVMNGLAQQRTSSGLTGQQIAERMLQHYHIHNVQITATGGMLTDHYNPANRTVNLSEGVYQQPSIAAAAVAAHECGHAVQHAKAYSFLQMRSALVPVVSIASRFSPWLLLAGIFTLQTFPQIMLLGIIALAGSTLFSFITLPVEFDASKRALAYLEAAGLARGEELAQAQKGLNWAAMTYVVAALGSLATLIYYATIFMRSQD
jgi:uncharacterized protein